MTAHSLPSARRHPPPLLLLALGLVLLAATAIAALAIGRAMLTPGAVSYTHLTLPTTPYV